MDLDRALSDYVSKVRQRIALCFSPADVLESVLGEISAQLSRGIGETSTDRQLSSSEVDIRIATLIAAFSLFRTSALSYKSSTALELHLDDSVCLEAVKLLSSRNLKARFIAYNFLCGMPTTTNAALMSANSILRDLSNPCSVENVCAALALSDHYVHYGDCFGVVHSKILTHLSSHNVNIRKRAVSTVCSGILLHDSQFESDVESLLRLLEKETAAPVQVSLLVGLKRISERKPTLLLSAIPAIYGLLKSCNSNFMILTSIGVARNLNSVEKRVYGKFKKVIADLMNASKASSVRIECLDFLLGACDVHAVDSVWWSHFDTLSQLLDSTDSNIVVRALAILLSSLRVLGTGPEGSEPSRILNGLVNKTVNLLVMNGHGEIVKSRAVHALTVVFKMISTQETRSSIIDLLIRASCESGTAPSPCVIDGILAMIGSLVNGMNAPSVHNKMPEHPNAPDANKIVAWLLCLGCCQCISKAQTSGLASLLWIFRDNTVGHDHLSRFLNECGSSQLLAWVRLWCSPDRGTLVNVNQSFRDSSEHVADLIDCLKENCDQALLDSIVSNSVLPRVKTNSDAGFTVSRRSGTLIKLPDSYLGSFDAHTLL